MENRFVTYTIIIIFAICALVFGLANFSFAEQSKVEAAAASDELKIWISATSTDDKTVNEVHIGRKVVLKFFGKSIDDENAYRRAIYSTSILSRVIKTNKSGLSDVWLDIQDNKVVGLVDKETIFKIEEDDEIGNNLPAVDLGFLWANNIRTAFGGNRLSATYKDFLIYRLKMKGNRVEVKKEENGAFQVVVNKKPIIKFFSHNFYYDYDRALLVSARIQDKIIKGLRADEISPGIAPNDIYYVRWGKEAIFALTNFDEKANNMPAWKLAMHAVDILRQTLSAERFCTETVSSFYTQNGVASWYGPNFHGRRTSNGERYDMFGYTAAHKTLPFGSEVLVTNLRNGKQLLVRITDRGPYIDGRIIDLTKTAASILEMGGLSRVRIDVIKVPEPKLKDDNRARLPPACQASIAGRDGQACL